MSILMKSPGMTHSTSVLPRTSKKLNIVTKCSEKGVVVVINSWSVISSRVTTDTGDTDTDDVCK